MANSTTKAVQQVSKIQSLRLIVEMRQQIKGAGVLREIMQLTKNFA